MPLPCPPDAVRSLVESVQEGLCESWLVEAPQRQTYGNGQPRRHFAYLVITVLAGIDHHFPKRIQLLHRHREFFPQQIHQARNARRSACHHDSLDVLAAGGCPEEVESLLNFRRQDVGNAAQYLLLLLVRDARQRITSLQPFRILEAEV